MIIYESFDYIFSDLFFYIFLDEFYWILYQGPGGYIITL